MSWKLGRVLGVEVGLHFSWILIAAWMVFALAARSHGMFPGWDSLSLWAGALLTAILFFLGLLAHELAHAAVANARGVSVKSITLFALGGIAQTDREPPDARSEFWIAAAGPAASFALGAASLAAAAAGGWTPGAKPSSPSVSIFVWLGYINVWLAMFNLLPGYPLDGGRVLRAAVWRFTGSRERSLRIAAQSGRVVAITLIALGIFRFAAGGGPGSIWVAYIGWFILAAAGATYSQVRVAEALHGVRVRDIMLRNCVRVDCRANLGDFIAAHMIDGGAGACFLVANGPQIVGVVTAREVRDIPRPQWPYRTVGDVMRPLEDSQAVDPDTLVLEALETMGRENVAQLAVRREGRLEGIISRSTVVGFLQSRKSNAL